MTDIERRLERNPSLTHLLLLFIFCDIFFSFVSRFILNKKIGVGQPKVIEDAKILIANTAMDTDKIKIYGSRVRVDSMNKAREQEKSRSKQEGRDESCCNGC